MRLIDADALLEQLDRYVVLAADDVRSKIKCAPTVDAEPVRHGKWEKHLIEREEYLYYKIVCSCCGGKPLYDEYGSPHHSDYCMHCGAKMDGE